MNIYYELYSFYELSNYSDNSCRYDRESPVFLNMVYISITYACNQRNVHKTPQYKFEYVKFYVKSTFGYVSNIIKINFSLQQHRPC